MSPDDLSFAASHDLPCDGCDSTTPPAELPPHAVDAWGEVVSALAQAVPDLDGVIADMVGDVSGELVDETFALHTALSTVGGEIEQSLSAEMEKINALLNRWMNEIGRAWDKTADELYHLGIILPYSPESMKAEMRGDVVHMLASHVPAISEIVGPVPTPDTTMPDLPPVTEPEYPPPTEPYPTPSPVPYPVPSIPPYPPQPVPVPFPVPVPYPVPSIPPPVPPVPYPPGPVPPPPPPPTPYPVPPIPGPVPPPPPPVVIRVPGGDGCCETDVTIHVPPPTVIIYPPPTDDPEPAPLPPPPPGSPPPPPPPQQLPPVQQPTPLPPPSGPAPGPPVRVPIRYPVERIPDIDWNDPAQCAAMEARVRAANMQGDQPRADSRTQRWIDSFKAGLNKMGTLADEIKLIPGIESPFADTAAWAADRAQALKDFTVGGGFVLAGLDVAGLTSIPNPGAAVSFGTVISLAAVGEQKSGFPMTYLATPELYALQWSNPMYLPTQGEIDNAYLRNTLSNEEWACWTRANGNLPEPARKAMLANQSRPGINDAIQLYYRGLITLDELRLRCREFGVLHDRSVSDWLELYKQLPTMVELLRYMVRDSADERVAELYDYDQGFTAKFAGKVKSWALAQGITDEQFKFYWRAHWEIPSNTALYSMFHRLRPDRPERTEWEAANPRAPGESWEKYRLRGPSVTTREDIEQAMQINDVAPAWVPRLLDVSYHPITRTDATRAFLVGAYNSQQLKDALLDAGYSPKDVETLMSFYTVQRRQRLGNVSGGWTVRKLRKYYTAGKINRTELEQGLARFIPDPVEMRRTVNALDEEIAADRRGLVITATRRGYMVGEMSADDAQGRLEQAGLDVSHAIRLVEDWTVVRDARYKQPSGAQILGWMGEGLIPPGEAHRRLTNLGYSKDDADRMIAFRIMKHEAKGELSADEAGGVWASLIRNAKQARAETNTRLSGRLAELLREMIRVRTEINRRRQIAGDPPLEPPQIP